jgi:hypothetical protein
MTVSIHRPPDILAARVNIADNPSMTVLMMGHHRYGAALFTAASGVNIRDACEQGAPTPISVSGTKN